MFDFEKLLVYKKATIFNSKIYTFLFCNKSIDKEYKDQLKRAAFSIPLNIAEGSGRTSKADRRHFFVIAIGSAFECIAILDQLKAIKLITEEVYIELYSVALEMSKMLFGLEKSMR